MSAEKLALEHYQQELDALRVDAERYGYDAEDWPVTLYTVSGSINDREWEVLATGSTLSAAIDAAMKGIS